MPYERWDVDTTYDPIGGIAKACAHPAEVVLHDSLMVDSRQACCTVTEGPGLRRYVRCGSWLGGLQEFDGSLFGVAPGDALTMDPQARILLEQLQVGMHDPASAQALTAKPQQPLLPRRIARRERTALQEAAGAAGGVLQLQHASTGVYIGCMYSEYLDSVLGPLVRPTPPCTMYPIQARFICT